MVLLWAVIVGFIAGLARAIVGKRRYRVPTLRYLWLLFAAYIPQFFAFQLPSTRSLIPVQWVAVILVGSQLSLLFFAMFNISIPGMGVLGLGLMLNFLVIVFNHGMMPISPEVVNQLLPANASSSLWSVGQRFGVSKDIVLNQGNMRLWFLSDMFVIPLSNNYHVALSCGDVLMSLGAVWLLWSLGSPEKINVTHLEFSKE